jgi:predicted dehydrogenase
MDYTTQGLAFRVKKMLRYTRLYGVPRTLVKIRGQYHMRRNYDVLPTLPEPSADAHVGLLGCGNFAYSNIAYYLHKNYGLVIRGAMDVDIHRAASLAKAYGAGYYTDKPDEVIRDKNIDLLYIASNHASHAEYAIEGLREGKAVHIEKPHVVNHDQLVRLCRTIQECNGRASLGFNRPLSRFGMMIADALGRESGAAMFNWFVAGHEIAPDHWYFHEKEGGRILGNLCHWTDFVLQLVPPEGRYPLVITPTRSERADCDIAVTFTFGDGTIAAITFSAKGHTFEGVRERFAAHKGNTLISMDDFQTLTIEVVEKKRRTSLWFRDHGHQRAIRRSYSMSRPVDGDFRGLPLAYIWETGELFLKTKEALESRQPVTVTAFSDEKLRMVP